MGGLESGIVPVGSCQRANGPLPAQTKRSIQPKQQSTQVDIRREGRDVLGRDGGRLGHLRPQYRESDATNCTDEWSGTTENVSCSGPRRSSLGPFFLEERSGGGRSSVKQSYPILIQ